MGAVYQGNTILTPAGRSAYQHAVAGGYQGTEADFNKLLFEMPEFAQNTLAVEGGGDILMSDEIIATLPESDDGRYHLEFYEEEDGGPMDANLVEYDNETSGLAATDTQAALDEIDSNVDTLDAALDAHVANLNNPHSVSAAQTGAYSTAEVDELLSAKVNPNLLENWYFANPVNQRGFSTTIGDVGYTIDRWKTGRYRTGTKSITLNDGFLSLDNQDETDGSYIEVHQLLENSISKLLIGRKVTFSVLTATGLYTRTVVPNGTDYYTMVIPNEGVIFMRALTDGQVDVRIRSNYGQHMDVEAIKLELGSQQTLAHQDENGNWVLNEIPDYGEQLRKCKLFYRIIEGGFSGVASPDGYISLFVPEINDMRSTPACTVQSTNRYISGLSGSAQLADGSLGSAQVEATESSIHIPSTGLTISAWQPISTVYSWRVILDSGL